MDRISAVRQALQDILANEQDNILAGIHQRDDEWKGRAYNKRADQLVALEDCLDRARPEFVKNGYTAGEFTTYRNRLLSAANGFLHWDVRLDGGRAEDRFGERLGALQEAQQELYSLLQLDAHEMPHEGTPPEAPPKLDERRNEILVALLRLKATGPNRARKRDDVAKKASESDTPSAYYKAIASLVRDGLVGSRKGPTGGIWLTPKGEGAAKALDGQSGTK